MEIGFYPNKENLMPHQRKYDAATRDRSVRLCLERLNEVGISKAAAAAKSASCSVLKRQRYAIGSASTKSRKSPR